MLGEVCVLDSLDDCGVDIHLLLRCIYKVQAFC